MKKFIVPPEYDGYEIGNYLKEVHNYSGRSLRNLEIYLNGKRIKNSSKKIKKLNRILVIERDKKTNIRPLDIPINIVYEDDNLLIINKDPYIIVHPTQKKVEKTLANGVVNYFLKSTGKTLVPRFFNRLDMNTSGLIIVNKNAHSQTFLQEKGEVKKSYLAIVVGIVEEDQFLIEKNIGKVGDELRRVELPISEGGQDAKTLIKVKKRFFKKNLTLVEATLFTGRTHQIRAHLSLIGFPILGDELYGELSGRAKRQMLHSYKLEFVNPKDNQVVLLEIPVPDDMKMFLE